MLILLVEVLCVIVLVMIFSTLLLDERRNRERDLSLIKLKGYWDGDERRTTDRLNVTMEVRYHLNGRSAVSRSMDISTKGIRILLDERIDKGTPIAVTMRIPGKNHLIQASGSIVWSSESKNESNDPNKRFFNTGIKFYSFRDSGERNLFNFIHEMEKIVPKNG